MKKQKIEEICKNCKWWGEFIHEPYFNSGNCHRFLRPKGTGGNESCGEFKKKKVAKQ